MIKVLSVLLLFPILILAKKEDEDIPYDKYDPLTAAISKVVKDAYELNKKGLEALEKKRYDEAIAAFEEALKILPTYSDAENNKGVAFFKKGIIGEARRIWETLYKRDPEYAIGVYNLGLLYVYENKLEEALRLFERASKLQNRFVEAIVRCGIISLELGKRDKGFEYLQKAYKMAPSHPDAACFYAYSLILKGDTASAVEILKKNESNLNSVKLLAEIEKARKNYKKAAEYFAKVVKAGEDPSVLVELASSLNESGQCKEAIATLEKYFSYNIPYSADAYLAMGIAHKDCGKIDEAIKFFEEGVNKYPRDPILSYNLGQLYFHKRKFNEAEEVWATLSDSLQDPSLLYFRALLAYYKKDLISAKKLIQKAISIDNRAEYHDLLGVIFHEEKNDKLAEEEFKKALALNPNLRSAQLNLALLSRKEEDMDLVTKSLEEKVNKCKGEECSKLYLQLAILYYHRKMLNKAVATLSSMREDLMEEKHYRHLALFYREMQEWQKAINTLETAAKKFVLELQTEYELAELYLFSGNYSQAIKKLLALIPKWTENPWRLYYQIGYAWLEQNNLEQAQFYFEKSLKSKENVAARGLLAFVLNRKGRTLEARKLWEKNLNEDPSNPVLWINMGLSLEQEKRYEEALSHYRKAQQLSPENKELYLNIGNALVGLQRYAEAIDAYNTALNSSKREIAAYNIFLVALKKREKERAEKMLALLEKEFTNSPYTRRCKSEMLLWNGDTAAALNILESIKEKDENDWLTLARVYAAKNSPQKAKEYLDKLPKDDPSLKEEIRLIEASIAFAEGNYLNAVKIMEEIKDTSFVAQYNLAIAKYHAGQYQDALNIAQALSLKAKGRDYADICRLAGNAAFSLKMWEEAKRWYSLLSNAEANNPVVQYNLAVANYNLNRIEEAWKYYQNARKLDQSLYSKDIEIAYKKLKGDFETDSSEVGDSTILWYNNAVELQQAGNDTAAEILYKKVVDKNPFHSEAWNNLGAIYGKRGDIDNAEKAYFKAIEKRHDIPETYANLVTLYIELEEFSKARKWITKGLGHNPDSELLQQLREKIEIAEKEVKKRKEIETKQKK